MIKETLHSDVVQKWEVEGVKIDVGYIYNIKVNVEVVSFPNAITGTKKTWRRDSAVIEDIP